MAHDDARDMVEELRSGARYWEYVSDRDTHSPTAQRMRRAADIMADLVDNNDRLREKLLAITADAERLRRLAATAD